MQIYVHTHALDGRPINTHISTNEFPPHPTHPKPQTPTTHLTHPPTHPPTPNRYFAPEIGKNFFPKSQPSLRAVRTFTVFAGGFLMRPIGSLLLGAIGDRFGTAAALKWSILLMTVPTVVTGCLPTYAKVGSTATFLLTACRLLQGLSGACLRACLRACVPPCWRACLRACVRACVRA